MAADAAKADDAERAAGKLAAHGGGGRFARVIGGGVGGNAAGEVDRQAEHELDHGRHEARPGAGDEHAGGAGGSHVHVANVHGDTDEGAEAGKGGEHRGWPLRHAVRYDHGGIGRHCSELCRAEGGIAVMQAHLGQTAQAGERFRAVVVTAHRGRVGEEDDGGGQAQFSVYETPSQRGKARVIAGTKAISSSATASTARYLRIGRATLSIETRPTAQAV